MWSDHNIHNKIKRDEKKNSRNFRCSTEITEKNTLFAVKFPVKQKEARNQKQNQKPFAHILFCSFVDLTLAAWRCFYSSKNMKSLFFLVLF